MLQPAPRQTPPEMACSDKCTKKVGRCFLFLILAILCDVAGLVIFLVGIFAPIQFWDLLVLSGPIIIFLSLVFWIFWYLGNLTVPYQELLPKWDLTWRCFGIHGDPGRISRADGVTRHYGVWLWSWSWQLTCLHFELWVGLFGPSQWNTTQNWRDCRGVMPSYGHVSLTSCHLKFVDHL